MEQFYEAGLTDMDMEAAQQLIQLSEGDTTMTPSTSYSSGNSCNSIFNAVVSEEKLTRKNKNKKRKDNYTSKNNDEGFIIAGELEDDDDQGLILYRRKNTRYRFIVDLYRVTKMVEC